MAEKVQSFCCNVLVIAVQRFFFLLKFPNNYCTTKGNKEIILFIHISLQFIYFSKLMLNLMINCLFWFRIHKIGLSNLGFETGFDNHERHAFLPLHVILAIVLKQMCYQPLKIVILQTTSTISWFLLVEKDILLFGKWRA